MTAWLRFWARAVRLYAVSASVTPVAVGALYARWEGSAFSWVRFAIVLAAGVALHLAANLWNDYFDFVCGVDHETGAGSGMLVSGELSPGRCFRGACVLAGLAAAGGIWLAVTTAGWGLVVLGAAGLVAAAGYCAGRHSPKHHALGELWVFLSMGLGMTLGGYMAQTGRFSFAALAAGVPVSLLTVLLLFNNNLRDIQSDRAAGIRTLPMLFGRTAKPFAAVLLMSAYLWTAGLVPARLLSSDSLLTLLSLPFALRWLTQIFSGPVTHREELAMARLHLGFGLLFILALLWASPH